MKKYKNYITAKDMRNLLTDIPESYQVKNDYFRKIEELQREKFDIRKYVDVVNTSFTKGTRPFQKSQAGVLTSVRINGDKTISPATLFPVNYSIKTFIGFIEVGDELLDDSEENTMDFLTKWLSQYSLNTYTKQVFNGDSSFEEAMGIFTEIQSGGKLESRVTKQANAPTVKELKTILNIDLKGLIKSNKKIFTNSTGFDYLEGMNDTSVNPVVYPDPTKESGWSFIGRELVEVPDDYFPDTEDGTPFILGDLKALYKMINYSDVDLVSSGHTKNGWTNSISEVKGTVKFDGVVSEDIEAIKILFSQMA
jgi:HK97 family phage major capsid protein